MPEADGGWEVAPRPMFPPAPQPEGPPPGAAAPGNEPVPHPSVASDPRSRPTGPPPVPQYGGPAFQRGSLRLLRVLGIDVFVHWSWLIVAVLEYQYHAQRKDMGSPVWYVALYLTLFGIVMLHEFGHALACRQVGGKADRIYLWPLGGVAFVQPPPRPEAYLWSLAAGPLVNLVLVPITLAPCLAAYFGGWWGTPAASFLVMICGMNFFLLFFNMLPIFPLDGGQILHALLWMVIGRAQSLLVVTILGLMGAGGLMLVGLVPGWWPLLVIGGFAALASLAGLVRARTLLRILNAPRHEDFACPACGTPPPAGEFWVCGRCLLRYDTFASGSVCPRCGTRPQRTMCPSCSQSYPFADWYATVLPADDGGAGTAVPGIPRADAGPVPHAVTPTAPAKPSVTLGQRLVWGGLFAAAVGLPAALLIGRQDWPTAVALAAGGALFGATSAAGFTKAWRNGRARSKLRGSWQLVEQDGHRLPEEEEPLCTTFSGPLYTHRRGKAVLLRGDLWLDPSREPKAMNLTPRTGPDAGKTYPGIYEIEGQQLTICYALQGRERPDGFRAGPNRSLLVFRRGG